MPFSERHTLNITYRSHGNLKKYISVSCFRLSHLSPYADKEALRVMEDLSHGSVRMSWHLIHGPEGTSVLTA